MSETEEMYLITIANLRAQDQDRPVPLSRLAEELEIVPVSANQMVKKLEASGMVRYWPYKGVRLTDEGQAIAAQVLRHRRLWETFLINHLELGYEEADSLACRMEHITSNTVAERLSAYLGNPEFTPGGKPIPTSDGPLPFEKCCPLSDLEAGDSGVLTSIEAKRSVIQFLASEGLARGAEVRVIARGSRGSLLLESKGELISLAPEVIPTIYVRSKAEKVLA
ncbi:MAG: metal-dependent transcriptional regulator [Anaerolineales bacterium]|nr:metal-dependent transcriptional regulator [Anaerolineales bacterium]